MSTSLTLYGFIMAVVAALYVIYVFTRLVFIYRSGDLIKQTAQSMMFVMGSFLSLNIASANVLYSYFFEIPVDDDASLAFGYMGFLILWILGNNMFLRRTIRLNKRKIRPFVRFNIILYIPIAFALIVSTITWEFIPAISDPVLRVIPPSELTQLTFVLMSQFAIVAFAYIMIMLYREKGKNSSKLVQARLQILIYSVMPMVIMSIGVLITSLYLVLNDFTGEQSYPALSIFIAIMALITMVSSQIILWGVNLPNFVRVRFNLAPSRYEYIKNA